MEKRFILKIDKNKCNGCGLCISACAEKVISIIDGKAHVINEEYCDGLGHCIAKCPEGAITIERKPLNSHQSHIMQENSHMLCPSLKNIEGNNINRASQWPIKLRLVNPKAQYAAKSQIIIAADCTPFIYKNFHNDIVKDQFIVIGCPKFDDSMLFRNKLIDIFTDNNYRALDIILMDVPCCQGFINITHSAMEKCNKSIPTTITTIGIDGTIKK